MRPKVSVIMPSLNMVQYIREAVESVLAQTLSDIEIISVDAGSTDGTVEILNEYAKKDERIKLMTCDEKSYGKQVNMALRAAKGKYVAIVDTDDFIDCNMYKELYEIAELNNLDFIKADYDDVYEMSNGEYLHIYAPIIPVKYNNSLYGKLLSVDEYPDMHVWLCYMWSGIYNRQFLAENNIWLNDSKGAAYQDIGFYHQVVCRAKRIMYIRKSFYRYRSARVGNSVTSKNGMRYLCQEYGRLYEQELVPLKDKAQWKEIYIKLAYSLMSECGKKGMYLYFEDEAVSPYLSRLCDVVKTHVEDGTIKEQNIGEDLWQQIEFLLDSYDKYAEYKKSAEHEVKSNLEKLADIAGAHPVIIFGSGARGRKFYKVLDYSNIAVRAFADNSKEIMGSKLAGVTVYSLEDCKQRWADAVYLVASRYHEEDIQKQLINEGIEKEKILTGYKLY